jgi:ABC-type lipoprotein export system ATPase subunit
MDGAIRDIEILGGFGKNGEAEPVSRILFRMGQVASIVGPTGSGKTTFINDLELFAQGDTPTGRRVLVNGACPPEAYREDPARNPIALITQHTTFLSDLPVGEFLETHARIRCSAAGHTEAMVSRTLAFANQLTGEPIMPGSRMTELSGGQTRALLIADATVLCDTPIVLLDEVENAGINRTRALELLREHRKIFLFVTHDPRIALLSDFRIVMGGGQVVAIHGTNDAERALAKEVSRMDDLLMDLRDKLRRGERLTDLDLGGEARP